MIFDFIFFVFQQIWFFAGIFILIVLAFSHMLGRRTDFAGMIMGSMRLVLGAIWMVLEMIWGGILSLFSKEKEDEHPNQK